MPAWPPTLTLHEPWAADVVYEPGAVVPYGGQTWRAVHRNLNDRPPSAAWTRQVPGGGVGIGGGHSIVGQDGAMTTRAALRFAHEEPAADAWGQVTDVAPTGSGTILEGALLLTIQGVQYHEGDKLASTAYIAKSITPSSDVHNGQGRPCEPIVIDKLASQTTVITFHNLGGTRNLQYARYDAAGVFIDSAVVAAPGSTGTLTLTGAADEYIAMTFDGGPGATAYGDFEVKVDTSANLAGPPVAAPVGGETVVTYPPAPKPTLDELMDIIGRGLPYVDMPLEAAFFVAPTPPIARAQYGRDNSGISRFRGAVKAVQTGLVPLGQVPTQLNPFRPMRFPIVKGNGAMTFLYIDENGAMTVTANANDVLYLDGVHFPYGDFGYSTLPPPELEAESPSTLVKLPYDGGVIIDGCGTVKGRDFVPDFYGDFWISAARWIPTEGFPTDYREPSGHGTLKPDAHYRTPFALSWTVIAGRDTGAHGAMPAVPQWYDSHPTLNDEPPVVHLYYTIHGAPYHPSNIYRICANFAWVANGDDSWYEDVIDS